MLQATFLEVQVMSSMWLCIQARGSSDAQVQKWSLAVQASKSPLPYLRKALVLALEEAHPAANLQPEALFAQLTCCSPKGGGS